MNDESTKFLSSRACRDRIFFLQTFFFRKGSLVLAAQPSPREKPTLNIDAPAAKKYGYNYDAMQVDTKKWKKKAGPDGNNQKCVNCTRYAAIDGNHGTCDIFPKNTVNWNGWCNSWAKNTES